MALPRRNRTKKLRSKRRLRRSRSVMKGGGSKHIIHGHVISIESSAERLRDIKLEAAKAGLELKHFPGVTPTAETIKNTTDFLKMGGNTYIQKISLIEHPYLLGSLGCTFSHKQLLEKIAAEESHMKIALVLEDDATIPEDFMVKVDKLIDSLPEHWHMCFLEKEQEQSVPVNDNVSKITDRFNTHKNYGTRAYLVYIPYIGEIIKCLERITDIIDVQYNYYSDRINTYIAKPHITGRSKHHDKSTYDTRR